jgi:hypothetical protein
VRVHDECNGSDVFGSDICTCRPYLTHAIEESIRTAQNGGTGVVIYYRKEGRALGEVTKYLVYNMRKRQEGGDQAKEYFNCTQVTKDMLSQPVLSTVRQSVSQSVKSSASAAAAVFFAVVATAGNDKIIVVVIPFYFVAIHNSLP